MKITEGYAVFNKELDTCLCYTSSPYVSKTRTYGRSFPNYQGGDRSIKLRVLKTKAGQEPYRQGAVNRYKTIKDEDFVIKRVKLIDDTWVIQGE